MNLRSFVKRTKAGQLIWRIFIGVLGGTITVLGAIALVASRAVSKTKSIAQTAADKVGMPTWIKYLIFAGAALFSIVAIIYYLMHN